MDSSHLALYSLTRILHVGTAVVLVGGTFFLRFVLMPAATQSLAEGEHERLRGALTSIWKKIVHGGIALLLITGGLNYYRVIVERTHKGDGLYHALLGVKMLLAIAVFFLASALVGRAPGFEPLRKNARKWIAINLILAFTIVAISGFLRVRGTPTRSPAAEPSPAAVTE